MTSDLFAKLLAIGFVSSVDTVEFPIASNFKREADSLAFTIVLPRLLTVFCADGPGAACSAHRIFGIRRVA
jgi:hypothetical protein